MLTGTPVTKEAHSIATEIWANRYEERFQYMRAWRPGRWSPRIQITGVENIDIAVAEGRGIVFWACNFSFNDLVTKMAWDQLNLKVSHFSRPVHGFSTTRFGIRYLNAVRRNIEDRYLGERLMTEPSDTRDAMLRLRHRLESGGIVSFTVGDRGRRRKTVRFLGGNLTLATGPLHLARLAGAVLLPVMTLRRETGLFTVTIHRPIELPDSADGEPDYGAAVQSYADILEPYVTAHPGQWKGWRFTSSNECRT